MLYYTYFSLNKKLIFDLGSLVDTHSSTISNLGQSRNSLLFMCRQLGTYILDLWGENY